MGGAGPVYHGTHRAGYLFLVARDWGVGIVRDFVAPFAIAFVAFCLVFLGLDFTIMKLQGLTLIFHP